MVMMCDLMVSTEDTMFYYPEAKLGVTGGMISSLVTRMPHKLAMEMMLLGTKVSAQRAYDVGFVNRVVAQRQHEAAALAMAETLLNSAPLVIGALKRLASEVILPIGPVERMVAISRPGEGAQQRGHAGRHRRPQGKAPSPLHRAVKSGSAACPRPHNCEANSLRDR